ncbi:MAG: MMPL family transporter [Solirubrobacterales bacterium]
MGALLFVAAAAAASSIFDAVEPFGFEDPDSEVARAHERFEDATGAQATPGVVALVEPGGGVRSTAGRSELDAVSAELTSVDGIAEVRGPTELGNAAISTDGRTAYVVGHLDADESDPTEVGERVLNELGDQPGVTVGGPAVAAYELGVQSEEDLRTVELFAVPILLLLSIWIFRSVIAALLPLVVGAFAIVTTIGAMRGVTEIVDLDLFSINIVTGLGLGLAIDYSLLVVARYREELERLGPGWDAVHRTLATAGRTVLFSGVTIACALAALLVFPQRFLYSVAIGGTLVAAISAIVAVTVLPAILASLGPRVNALPAPRLRRQQAGSPESGGGWYRLASFVMKRPIPVATLTAAFMIAVGIPFLKVDLTTPDARILPEERSARIVDDRIGRDFRGPATTPLVAVIEAPSSSAARAAGRPFAARLERLPDVDSVSGPHPLGDDAQELSIVASVDPLSDEGQALLREIRSLDWPFPTLVGGRTAELVDQKESLERHLPLAIAIIAVVTVLILWAATGSLLLPFVALVMNLLTISAAFGILVLIFQDGRLESLLDFTSQGALDSSVPILLFAVVFGLSTDYGIFLLSRIKETRDDGATDSEAVAIGLERTGRIVTAAALMFGVAMGAFVVSELVILKETAVGLCVAVLLDATIVRALLLPSLMRLLGRWAWWAPRPIGRLHERFGVS